MQTIASLIDGVQAIGFLVLTFLHKIAITVREQTLGVEIAH